MARKRIETALGSWLEITSSSVSKAIRSLTTSDMGLLSINESPNRAVRKLFNSPPRAVSLLNG